MEDETPPTTGPGSRKVFVAAFDTYNDPAHIVTFGHYYAVTHLMETRAAYSYIERHGLDETDQRLQQGP